MNVITVKEARKTIANAFKCDPDFRDSYIANVSCILMDNLTGLTKNKTKRDNISDIIIRRLIED